MRQFGATDVALLEQAFEQLPDCPFFAKDASLRYVAANSAMARLCGVRKAGDLYGRVAGNFFPGGLAKKYEALDRQVLNGGEPVTSKLELTLGAGERPTWLLFSRLPILAPSGECVGIVAVARQLKGADGAQATYSRLQRVAERLCERFDGPLELGELAKLAGISKSQLERDFSRTFGVPLRVFHQQARLREAVKLLRSDRSIAQVAHECGYSDHSAFTRAFRQAIGSSPREYRRSLREGEPSLR